MGTVIPIRTRNMTKPLATMSNRASNGRTSLPVMYRWTGFENEADPEDASSFSTVNFRNISTLRFVGRLVTTNRFGVVYTCHKYGAQKWVRTRPVHKFRPEHRHSNL